MTEAEAPEAPRRHLGLADATALYAGIILGSGIFVAPAAVAAAAPKPAVAVLLWIAGALVTACGAACYAECSSRVPVNGGFFAFQRAAYGDAIPFVGGWAALLVTYPASVAAIALVCAGYFGEAVGASTDTRPVACAALAAAGALNAAGLRTGPRTQTALTAIKLAALAALAAAALVGPVSRASTAAAPVAAAAPVDPAAWLAALMLLLWTYDGWSDVSLVAGEIRDPARNLGRAMLVGTGLLALVYAAVQAAVMRVLPGGAAAASMRPVADAVAATWGPGAARGVASLVVVSTFGSIAGTVLGVSRLGHRMAWDGALPRGLARLDPRRGTPVRSIAVVTAASIVYALVGSFRAVLAYFTFSVWIFYGLTAIAVLVLRRRRVGAETAWRAPLGPLPPVVVLVVGAVMTVQIVRRQPVEALVGAAMLAAGFAVYAVSRRFGVSARSVPTPR